MTIVMALRASDGVVVAADSQITWGGAAAPQIATISAPAEKVVVVDGFLIWGWAGAAGLAQRIAVALASVATTLKALDANQMRDALTQVVTTLQRQAAEQQVAGTTVVTVDSIFAWIAEDGYPRILRITESGADELIATHVSIGSGWIFGTYALQSRQHLDVGAGGIDRAKVIALRTVGDLIQVSAFGLGGPVRICAVTGAGATEVGDDEMAALGESVDLWREMEGAALGALGPEFEIDSDAEGQGEELALDPPLDG